jgi:hypothetical protein
MTKLEKLIKEKCDVPIVSVKIYKADKLAEELGVAVNEIIATVKFCISTSATSELLKSADKEDLAGLIAKYIDETYKEKMELAGIKEAEFVIK